MDLLHSPDLSKKNVLIGCTGSVATIKVPEICRKLKLNGHNVIIVPTKSALHFLKTQAVAEIESLENAEKLSGVVGNENSVKKYLITNEDKYFQSKYESSKKIKFDNLDCLLDQKDTKKVIDNDNVSENKRENMKNSIKDSSSKEETTCFNVCAKGLISNNEDSTSSVNCKRVEGSMLNEEEFSIFNVKDMKQHYSEFSFLLDEDEWLLWQKRGDTVLHIKLREWADLFLVAPLDANTLAKMAQGLCDNLLTCVVRAWDLKKPLIFCPAMNTHMYNHPFTDKHIQILKSLGYIECPSIKKRLVCGDYGLGAMAEVPSIIQEVENYLK